MAEIPVTPVRGYRQLTQHELNEMNRLKAAERDALEALNETFERVGIDGLDMRWLSIARSHIEQGFMCAVRSIARPESLEPAWVMAPMAGRKPTRTAPAADLRQELHDIAAEKDNGGVRP